MTPPASSDEAPAASVLEIPTPVGPARATVHAALDVSERTDSSGIGDRVSSGARVALVLGHGAGGTGPTADLSALTGLTRQGWIVVLVDQPWRVAGRRVAGPAAQLDTAWRAIWGELRGALAAQVGDGPLVAGGRSSGARVVARTADELAPDGLLLLSFPLTPPRRGGGHGPSRAPELAAAAAATRTHGAPVLVVQGSRDPFGAPAQIAAALAADTDSGRAPEAEGGQPAEEPQLPPGIRVESVSGDHSLSRSAARTASLVGEWLSGPAFAGSWPRRAE